MTDNKSQPKIDRADLGDLDAVHGLFMAYLAFYERDADSDSARAFLRDRIQNEQSVIFVAWVDGQAFAWSAALCR